MKYRFTSSASYPYKLGDLYLGADREAELIGVNTERHAITIAGARSGKGACQIIGNLKCWTESILVIDPSGENIAATWEQLKVDKYVALLDPFHIAEREHGVPAKYRVSINPLDTIKPDNLTVREDIRVIADGLVKRYKPEDGTWDNGAVSVLAGMIAYVAAQPDPKDRTLANVRYLLTLPEEARKQLFEEMQRQEGYGNLARAAASIGLSKTKKNQEFVGGASDHSEWLDSEPMVKALSSSDFSLSKLKTGSERRFPRFSSEDGEKLPVALFLILPHEYINEHSRFLRLFVRCAIDAMTKSKSGYRCLFLLDEFFSLGTIDEIAKAAGALPKFGVHLWPFLQDLGQLHNMYGPELSETFFGNSDATCFFGNTDGLTLEYISKRLGVLGPNEIKKLEPERETPPWYIPKEKVAEWRKTELVRHSNKRSEYDHARISVGMPRMAPEEIAKFVARRNDKSVARRAIVFAKGGDVLEVRLTPYFDWAVNLDDDDDNENKKEAARESFNRSILITIFCVAIISFIRSKTTLPFGSLELLTAVVMYFFLWRPAKKKYDSYE